MPSKFDTNPLDPDFPERARAAAETQVLSGSDAQPRRWAESDVEVETRRFQRRDTGGTYQGYNGQDLPATHAYAGVVAPEDARRRKVAKIGLSENIVTALPYLPSYIGLVAGLILLVLLPKSEAKSRFHAAQGLAAHLGILIVVTLLSGIANVTNMGHLPSNIFQLVTGIMMIIFAIKAWQGKPVHIEPVDGLTNWLEDKIDPKLIDRSGAK